MYYFFNDMSASTYPLLSIDCVSKEILARVSGLVAIVISVAGFLSVASGRKMADVNPTRVFIFAALAMATTMLLALWRIKEPPVYHPAKGKFNLLAPIKIALQRQAHSGADGGGSAAQRLSNDLQHLGMVLFQTKLGLTIGETGAEYRGDCCSRLGFVSGGLVDRPVRKLRGVVHRMDFDAGSCAVRHPRDESNGLILLMVLFSLFTPLQVAGDTILWKTMDKADTGSYTSTASLIRNFCTGTVIAISGYIIKWTGSYVVAFWFGFALVRSL